MPRLNLSIPAQIDAVLRRLQELTGRGMASIALDALTASLPQWQRLVRELETSEPSTPGASQGIGVKPEQQITDSPPHREPGEGKAAYQFRLKAWQKRQTSR